MKDVILLPNINLYSPFLMKLPPCPLLLIYFAFNSSVSTIDHSMSKNWVWPTLSVFFVSSFMESSYFGTSEKNNAAEKQPESSPGGFC